MAVYGIFLFISSVFATILFGNLFLEKVRSYSDLEKSCDIDYSKLEN